MKYKENVILDLNMTLEDDYVLSKIEEMQNTNLVKDGDEGSFSFNLTDLFKKCPMIFKQANAEMTQDEIKKLYETNKKKFQKLLNGNLGKAINRFEVKRTLKGKRESYFKFNKTTMTILKNGYPSREVELTEIEKLVIKELNIDTITKSIAKQLKEMDIKILKEAIECAKETGILDYPFVKSIYNNLMENKKVASVGSTNNSVKQLNTNSNDINSISDNNKNIKQNYNSHLNPKVHNFEGSANFLKYSPEELEKLLFENQKNKFK